MVRTKPYVAEPLRLGQSIGAALAFSGVARSAPLLLGAQGCAAVAGSLLARHFRRPAPIRAVAMNETSAALGGEREIEKALAAAERDEPLDLIGLVTGGVNETRGDDLDGLLRRLNRRRQRPSAELIGVSTPDFSGSLQDGWSRAVERMVEFFARPAEHDSRRIALLPGCHLTPADVEALKSLCLGFDLKPVVLPDLSGALDRRDWKKGFAGVAFDELRAIGSSIAALGFGAHIRKACESLADICRVPAYVFDAPFGLSATDELIRILSEISGRTAPQAQRKARDRLIDVLADSAEIFSGSRVAVAGEADMAFALAALFGEWGVDVEAAIVAASAPGLRAPFIVGDFQDLEMAAADCDLIAAPSVARRAAQRLGVPLWRCGLPITDRIDAPFRVQIGYGGARRMIFEVAALLAERTQGATVGVPFGWSAPEANG
ncbi:MAG: nitrogenase iron-molybdenum cofactor biosynthesis protein NifN [Methylocystaceae bacterium]|nr:MAG: nitrogenase iron-molybdenum cofactor biosynthesis protein NifN [Methylocystaceae bacterium]